MVAHPGRTGGPGRRRCPSRPAPFMLRKRMAAKRRGGGGRMTDRPPRGTNPGKLARIDTSTAHSARIYNYWLGGKDSFPADREAAEAAMAANPGIVADVRANRAFLARAARYLVAEAGIRQFLDIGTGLPTADNTHEVAQAVAPESRIVYVDNDPIVLTHARALLSSTPEGAAA